MIRFLLPALLATSAHAQTGPCRNIPYSAQNCVPVLACVGDQGLFFEGRAFGWGEGRVSGFISDDTFCEGTWAANGPSEPGTSALNCTDGTDIDVLYYTQDNATGTVVGEGEDSRGREILAWTGENVKQFLTGPDAFGPALPCVQGDIPIS